MSKFRDFLNKNGLIVIILLLVVIYIRTCNINKKIEVNKIDTDKRIESVKGEVLTDSVIKGIYEESMWDFLIIEEIGDEKGISINKLKLGEYGKKN